MVTEVERLRECVKVLVMHNAYEYHLDNLCTIPDGQARYAAERLANGTWKDFIPVKFRDLFDGVE